MYFTTVQCITANERPESLCGIELTMIRNSRLYQKKSWLFQPPELIVSPSILGNPAVSLSMLMDAPHLHEVWDEILSYLDGQFIVFHQLPENIRALTKAISFYGLQQPSFTFGSAMMLAKRLYPNLPSAKLSSLCEFLGIPYTHKQIGDHTMAVAEVLLKIGRQFNEEDEEALFTKGGICLGSFRSDGICFPDFISPYSPPVLAASSPMQADPALTVSLRNQVICLTGPLESMTRAMAVKKLTFLGAHYQSQITSRTTMVVTNLYDHETGDYKRLTTKLQKALILKGQGQSITIIDEKEFIDRLKRSGS